MKTYLFALCVAASLQAYGQSGAEQLFGQTNSRLTAAQKQDIFSKTGFRPAADGKQFIMEGDERAEFPFEAQLYPTDLNGDGKEEVFILYGNSFTSGHTGSSIMLFVPDARGSYQLNLGFPAAMIYALPGIQGRYPDLAIGGPGSRYPVWRWNGQEYDYHGQMNENQLQATKSRSMDEISAAYTGEKR